MQQHHHKKSTVLLTNALAGLCACAIDDSELIMSYSCSIGCSDPSAEQIRPPTQTFTDVMDAVEDASWNGNNSVTLLTARVLVLDSKHGRDFRHASCITVVALWNQSEWILAPMNECCPLLIQNVIHRAFGHEDQTEQTHRWLLDVEFLSMIEQGAVLRASDEEFKELLAKMHRTRL